MPTLASVPIITHARWAGHVRDVISLLEPLTDPDADPQMVMMYLDNAAESLCAVHAVIMAHLLRSAMVALDMSTADVGEACRGLMSRPDETAPYDTTD